MAESFASRLEHPVTVLIAEDEDLLRALLARTLWAEGYRTLEARDGGVALLEHERDQGADQRLLSAAHQPNRTGHLVRH